MTSQPDDPIMARRAARLGALLTAADTTPRAITFPAARIARAARRRRVTRWSAAAIVVLAVGGALAQQPLRAWVVARVQAAWHAIAGVQPAAAPGAALSPAASPSSVSFTPASGNFTVRVRTWQAAGTLTVHFAADSLVRASVLGAGGEWLVRPDGVDLVNAAASTASVLLEVPRRTPSVTIVIGARQAVVTRDATVQLASPEP